MELSKVEQIDALERTRAQAINAIHEMVDVIEGVCPKLAEKASRSWVSKILEHLGEVRPSLMTCLFSYTYQDTLDEIIQEVISINADLEEDIARRLEEREKHNR